MTTTLLLLIFALLFSPISLQFAESTEYVVPIEESPVAVEEYNFPTEESTVAVEEYISPTEESTVVVEESVIPIEESTTPTEEQPSHFLALDVSQYAGVPHVQGLLYIGVQDATQEAIQAGLLPSGTYQVSRVKSIERNTDVPIDSFIRDYRFFVAVVNGQGDKSTILFEIRYDPAEGDPTVISYSVAEPGTEDILPGYIPQDLSIVRTDPNVQGYLQIGMRNATGQAIEAGSLLNGTYYVDGVNSIMQNLDVVVFLVKYRFDVNISSFDSYNISNLVFEVTADPSSGPPEVISYSIKNVTNTTTTDDSLPEGFLPIDMNSDEGRKAYQIAQFGLSTIVNYTPSQGSIPVSDYQLSSVNRAGKLAWRDQDYYWFDIYATDGLGKIIEWSYTVIDNPRKGQYELGSYQAHNVTRI